MFSSVWSKSKGNSIDVIKLKKKLRLTGVSCGGGFLALLPQQFLVKPIFDEEVCQRGAASRQLHKSSLNLDAFGASAPRFVLGAAKAFNLGVSAQASCCICPPAAQDTSRGARSAPGFGRRGARVRCQLLGRTSGVGARTSRLSSQSPVLAGSSSSIACVTFMTVSAPRGSP